MSDNFKLGIVVVYLMNEDDENLLKIHLDFIKKYTPQDFTIYAAANRLHQHLKSILKSHDFVRICSIPDTNLRLAYENTYYLQHLIDIALEDNCTHIALFHPDSFPIKYNWFQTVIDNIGNSYAMAAIVTNLVTNNKPHSSFMLFEKEFYLKYSPKLIPDFTTLHTPIYREYIKEHSVLVETGIGYGFCLYHNKLNYYKLLHSNKNYIHPDFALIYDDLIFHIHYNAMPYKSTSNFYNFKGGEVFKFINNLIALIIPDKLFSSIKASIIKKIKKSEDIKNRNIIEELKNRLYQNPENFINNLIHNS